MGRARWHPIQGRQRTGRVRIICEPEHTWGGSARAQVELSARCDLVLVSPFIPSTLNLLKPSLQCLGSLHRKTNQSSPFHTYHCLWGCSGLALSLGLNGSKFKAADKSFPRGPVVESSPSNAGAAGSSSAWEVKIPYAFWPRKQNIKQKQYCNKVNEDFNNGLHLKKKSFFKKSCRQCPILPKMQTQDL